MPVDGDPAIVFPREARWVGDHGEAWMEQVFAEHPGGWIADRARDKGWRRVGVSGLDYVMAVRDYRALADGPAELVPFDEQFDLARAVKSEAELESVREGMRINEAGVEAVLRAYEVGKTEAELMGEAERVFTAAGCYRTTMDMILGGPDGGGLPGVQASPRPRRGSRRATCSSTGSRSPGRAATGSSSRARSAPGEPSADTLAAMDAYHEYAEAARGTMKAGLDRTRRPPGGLEGVRTTAASSSAT